jgi:hypothetical protein
LVRVVGYKVAKHLNLRLGKETKGLQVENTEWEGSELSDVRFRAPQW